YFQELEKHYLFPISTTSRNIVAKLIFSILYSTSLGNFREFIELIQSIALYTRYFQINLYDLINLDIPLTIDADDIKFTQVSASKSSNRSKEFTCYKCGKLGHIAKNCLLEKTEKFKAQYKLIKWSDKEKEQDKNINLVTVKSSEEEEKQNEFCKEEALRKKAEIQEQEESMPMEAEKIIDSKPKRILKKCFLLIVDKLQLYDISEDLLNTRAQATY
ncbi:19912_t:CDS:2, partial [Gigaspora margarita]